MAVSELAAYLNLDATSVVPAVDEHRDRVRTNAAAAGPGTDSDERDPAGELGDQLFEPFWEAQHRVLHVPNLDATVSPTALPRPAWPGGDLTAPRS